MKDIFSSLFIKKNIYFVTNLFGFRSHFTTTKAMAVVTAAPPTIFTISCIFSSFMFIFLSSLVIFTQVFLHCQYYLYVTKYNRFIYFRVKLDDAEHSNTFHLINQ